jgi:hypothetical protein
VPAVAVQPADPLLLVSERTNSSAVGMRQMCSGSATTAVPSALRYPQSPVRAISAAVAWRGPVSRDVLRPAGGTPQKARLSHAG